MCFRARVDDKRRHDVISSSTRRMAHIATRLLQFFHPFDFVAPYTHTERAPCTWLRLQIFVTCKKKQENKKKWNNETAAFSKELSIVGYFIANLLKSAGKLAPKICEILPREYLKN